MSNNTSRSTQWAPDVVKKEGPVCGHQQPVFPHLSRFCTSSRRSESRWPERMSMIPSKTEAPYPIHTPGSREVNPYPNLYTLLFWHDLWKGKIEEHNADWREQAAYLRENGLEVWRRDSETMERPWLALKAAYEAQQMELETLKSSLGI